MKSNLMSRRDLDFLLFEWLRIDELTKRERFAEHSRDTFAAVLDLCEELATRYFAPHNKTGPRSRSFPKSNKPSMRSPRRT
jgi:Acyl-CoA dehydrogenase N terminal